MFCPLRLDFSSVVVLFAGVIGSLPDVLSIVLDFCFCGILPIQMNKNNIILNQYLMVEASMFDTVRFLMLLIFFSLITESLLVIFGLLSNIFIIYYFFVQILVQISDYTCNLKKDLFDKN